MKARVLVAALFLGLAGLVDATGGRSAGVDPRTGGLEVGMGEWSVVPEVPAIRPGRVTFVIANRGKVLHGFRIESNREGESGGDRFRARSRTFRPGETGRLTVTLAPGLYTIECFVEGHDDLGMQRSFRVSASAPLVARGQTGGTTVRISGFVFRPAVLRATTGSVIKWTNDDPAAHTVTSSKGSPLTSRRLQKGDAYTFRFSGPGTYAYLCAIHPAMKGRVIVSPR
jgi:plastocyanin